MRRNMDAFIAAVEDALHRLIRAEGRAISMREVLRLAGYTDENGTRAGAQYHLNKQKKWPKGHDVPPDLVRRLSEVLPVTHEELAAAAQVARGYNVRVAGADLPTAYARFLEDSDVEPGEKTEVTARLLQIIVDETARRSPSNSH